MSTKKIQIKPFVSIIICIYQALFDCRFFSPNIIYHQPENIKPNSFSRSSNQASDNN